MIEITFGALVMILLIVVFGALIFGVSIGEETVTISGLVFILLMVWVMSQNPEEQIYHHTNDIEIHSTAGNYNQISGAFFLGTGYIDSEEMYAGNTFDGEFYERIYIPVKKVKRKMVNKDIAIWHRQKCTYKSTWLFKNSVIFDCKNKDILEVPTGTIIKDMDFQ